MPSAGSESSASRAWKLVVDRVFGAEGLGDRLVEQVENPGLGAVGRPDAAAGHDDPGLAAARGQPTQAFGQGQAPGFFAGAGVAGAGRGDFLRQAARHDDDGVRPEFELAVAADLDRAAARERVVHGDESGLIEIHAPAIAHVADGEGLDLDVESREQSLDAGHSQFPRRISVRCPILPQTERGENPRHVFVRWPVLDAWARIPDHMEPPGGLAACRTEVRREWVWTDRDVERSWDRAPFVRTRSAVAWPRVPQGEYTLTCLSMTLRLWGCMFSICSA